MASKYQPLSERLAAQPGAEWRANFAELEAVLGFALPKAARTGKAWWKNDVAGAWTEAGWAAEAEPAAGWVTFRRAAAALPVAADEPAILKRLEVSPKWGVALLAGSAALVVGMGAFAVRGWMRRK